MTWTLALGFAAVVVVLAGWVLLAPDGRAQHPSVQAAPGSATRGPATSAATTPLPSNSGDGPAVSANDHPPSVGSSVALTAAPDDVTWQLYEGVALPYSKTAGPTSATGGTTSGYTHDAEGALIAAIQISVRYLLAPNWQAVTAADVAPGAGRNAYVALRQGQPASSGSVTPGTYLQMAGFQFASYRPTTAVIELLSQGSTGTYQSITATVVWLDGDWKLQLQPNGSASPSAEAVSTPAGFIVWGGV